MFKSFVGYNLEAERRKAKNHLRALNSKSRLIKIVIAIIVFLMLWNMPSTWLGIPDLTVIEQRVIACFCLASLMWVFNAIPAWNTYRNTSKCHCTCYRPH